MCQRVQHSSRFSPQYRDSVDLENDLYNTSSTILTLNNYLQVINMMIGKGIGRLNKRIPKVKVM